jgi:hypothetical protein
VVAYRAVKLVGTGFKVHFEFGAPTRLYVVGFLLDPVTFDLQACTLRPAFSALNT